MGKIDLRYDDYAQSANTIFNFMKKSEYLKEILESKSHKTGFRGLNNTK